MGCDGVCGSGKVVGGCDHKCGSRLAMGCDGVCGSGAIGSGCDIPCTGGPDDSTDVLGCDGVCGSGKVVGCDDACGTPPCAPGVCRAGYFKSGSGPSDCAKCPEGKTCPMGSLAQGDCVCAPLYFPDEGSDTCSPCLRGCACGYKNSSRCYACIEGYYGGWGKPCVHCRDGKYSAFNSRNSSDCH